MQIALTFRNNLRNVKRRVLHTRGFRMCYITRPRLGRAATHLGLVLVVNTTMDGYCNKYPLLIKTTRQQFLWDADGCCCLISFSRQFINKSLLYHSIGTLWIKLICTCTKKNICVIKKFWVLKFQFHILHILLIGRCFLYYKIHILAVTFKRLFDICVSVIQCYLHIKKVTSLLSLI